MSSDINFVDDIEDLLKLLEREYQNSNSGEYTNIEIKKQSSTTIVVRMDATTQQRRNFLGSLTSKFDFCTKYVMSSSRSSVGHVEFCNKYFIIAKPHINTQTPEKKVIESLSYELQNSKNMDIVIHNKNNEKLYMIHDVHHVSRVTGNYKADFIIHGKYDTIYVSHKNSGDMGGFQQYSGVSKLSDGLNNGIISQHPVVLDFLEKISQKYYFDILTNKKRYFSYINDEKLITKAIYGPHFGQEKYDKNNVHFFAQGDPIFEETDHCNLQKLSFTENISFNGDISSFIDSAIILARYGNDRQYIFNDRIYKKIRIMIAPKELIKESGIEI